MILDKPNRDEKRAPRSTHARFRLENDNIRIIYPELKQTKQTFSDGRKSYRKPRFEARRKSREPAFTTRFRPNEKRAPKKKDVNST